MFLLRVFPCAIFTVCSLKCLFMEINMLFLFWKCTKQLMFVVCLRGDVFLEWAHSVPSAYVQFCIGQERALTLLTRCSSSETRLRMFLAHAVSHPQCQGDSLRHLLALPSQRLSRYTQILTRFVDATPVEHPDYLQLQYVREICNRTIDEVAEKLLAVSATDQWAIIRRQMTGLSQMKVYS
jgi:hypothetical protein